MFFNKISCVIPAYNEENRVGKVVKVVKSCSLISEVIVVSDGSIDKTAEEAKLAGADKVIELKENIGKGGAVFKGAEIANYPILLLLDADLISLKEEHLKRLIDPFFKKEVDMVIGVLKDDLGQKILPLISGQRVVRRDFILRFPEIKKSRFNLEILMNKFAKKLKYKVVFVELENLYHFKKEEKYKNEIYLKKKIESIFFWTEYFFKKVRIFAAITILAFFILKPYKISSSYLQLMPMPKETDRIMLVVAHPDDKVIGAGGYLAEAVKNKAEVLVVVLTNGERSKLFNYFLKDNQSLKNISSKENKSIFLSSFEVLKHLGITKDRVIFLDFPSKHLAKLLTDNWSKPFIDSFSLKNKPSHINFYNYDKFYSGQDLLNSLDEIFKAFKPNIVITHSLYDYNYDHKATFLFVDLVFKNNPDLEPQFYTFLIPFNNLSKILNIATSDLPTFEEKMKNFDFYVFNLTNEVFNLKEEAMEEYENDITSLYLEYFFKIHLKNKEIFIKEDLNKNLNSIFN